MNNRRDIDIIVQKDCNNNYTAIPKSPVGIYSTGFTFHEFVSFLFKDIDKYFNQSCNIRKWDICELNVVYKELKVAEKIDDTEKTIGEDRVRVDFNVDKDSMVEIIKKRSAELINICNNLKTENPSEKNRLISLAQTAYEEACMWAVKAATNK